MRNLLGALDIFNDAVARAVTAIMLLYIVGRFVLEYFRHPPGFQYLAAALALDIGDGYYTLLLHVVYFVAVGLVAGNAYLLGGAVLETDDGVR